MPNHARVALPTVALTMGAIPAPSTTNARTSCKVSNRTGRVKVRLTSHAPATASKGVADVDQESRRQWTVEPQKIAEQFSQAASQHPPRPAVAGCDDKCRDEKPRRWPDGNTCSRDDRERLRESAGQHIGRNKKPQVQELGAVRPDADHQLFLQDRQSQGIVSVSYCRCSQFRVWRAHIRTVTPPHCNRNSWKPMHCAGM